jgi:hypothetical protein
MRLHDISIALSIAVLSVSTNAQQLSPSASALDALGSSKPQVTWIKGSVARADLNCDGKADTAVIGHEGDTVWLGIVPGGTRQRAVTMRFLINRHAQDSFCAVPVRIETYPMECENEDGPLAGCKRVRGCSAFSVIDDQCDSFHFYWKAARKSFTWWRR